MPAVANRILALSPFGPIFGKELRVTARRRRSYLLRVLYLGALLLVMAMAWAGSRNAAYGPNTVAARTQAQEQMGSAFFICFIAFTSVAMLIIGPVLTATAISSERLGRTLNVLLATPITTWQIIGGKLASRLLIALTLIGLSLPVLAISRLLGGIELSQMVGGICVPATAAVFAAAVGLFFSTLMRRAFAVILLSYAALGVLEVFVPFVGTLALNIGSGPRGAALWANINLFAAMAGVMEPALSGQGGNPLGVPIAPWIVGCLLHLAVAALLVFCSGLMLRRVASREGGGAGGIDPTENIPVAGIADPAGALPPPLSETPGAVPPPLPTGIVAPPRPAALAYSTPAARGPRAARPRDVSDNPVLWREVRRPLTSRRWQAVLFSVLAVAILLISYATVAASGGRGLGDPGAHMGYALIFNGLLWLLVTVISATSVAQEKESDTWTLLLTTPVTGRTIVFGKAAGLLRRFMGPFALMVVHFALFTTFGIIRPEAFVLVIWVMIAFNLVWVATGIYLSLRLRTATFAVILNMLLALIIYPGAAIGLFLAGELLGQDNPRRDKGGRWAQQVSWYMPYSYLAMGMEGLERMRQNAPGFGGYRGGTFWLPCDLTADLPPPNTANYYDSNYFGRNVEAPAYFGVVFVVGSLHLLAALALLLWTARRFDRIVGRAPQRELVAARANPSPAASASVA